MPADAAPLKVLFAPDWRAGNPYQQLLADALAKQGVDVAFAPQTQGLFRLAKAARRSEVAAGPFDILHLHWPEAYFPVLRDRRDFLRRAFFPADLRLALAGRPLVYTGHNLYPHNTGADAWVRRASRAVVRGADAILAHSDGSVEAYAREFGVAPDKFRVIPHGDLAVSLPPPPAREEALARLAPLGVAPDGRKLCLVFGAVDPYKGIAEILDAFVRERPADLRLAIVGGPRDAAYAGVVEAAAAKVPGTILRLARVNEAELADWMVACDCMLFNYRAILTSGSACLARSWGVPLALPFRLSTVDLMEPDPSVVRFADGPATLVAAVRQAAGFGHARDKAEAYRAATAWDEVARGTAAVYRNLLVSGRRIKA